MRTQTTKAYPTLITHMQPQDIIKNVLPGLHLSDFSPHLASQT